MSSTTAVVTELQLSMISDDVGNCWRELGPRLEIAASKIRNLNDEYSTNRDRANALLIKWKQEKGTNALVGRLADHLKEIGRTDIAEELVGQHQKCSSSDCDSLTEERIRRSEVAKLITRQKDLEHEVAKLRIRLKDLEHEGEENECSHETRQEEREGPFKKKINVVKKLFETSSSELRESINYSRIRSKSDVSGKKLKQQNNETTTAAHAKRRNTYPIVETAPLLSNSEEEE
ncbi:uncharacterized protein LOC122951183 [Acropora millepora]|uniref:uncharacterized protein LOC122951183 n=1 Tax=Acropora millepora TaxID=45264 RepID=UPI001CF12CEA|nr:uncharacterized protein LOC122951183 [Acropora millepora]